MFLNKFRNYFFLIPLTILCFHITAQENISGSFYKHFTGNLDTTMKITMDLFSQNGKVSGFYYYYFPEPDNEDFYHYGKTIPIQGNIYDNYIVLNEYSNLESSFKGTFDSENGITGVWEKEKKDESIPFDISENYENGSLSFTCYTKFDQRVLSVEGGNENESPKAKINLYLLHPNLTKGNPLKDTLDRIITQFLINKSELINSPELLLENITFDFFNSYYKATEGIEDLSSTASFNWGKNITMDICHNENNIVSIKVEKYAFTGGAHGISMTEFVVCDLNLRKRLELNDIFKEGARENLDALLDKKLRRLNGITPEEKLNEAGFFVDKMEATENFYINKDGIGFFYNIYHIAPYSSGTTELLVPFREIKDLFRSDHPISWIRK